MQKWYVVRQSIYLDMREFQNQLVTSRLNRIRINSLNAIIVDNAGLEITIYRGCNEFHLCNSS